MDIVLRAIVVFAFLLVLTRIIGKRELSVLGEEVEERGGVDGGDLALEGC